MALSELVMLLKLGVLWSKLKIINANFFPGIWLIFSMLFSSHPKSKWREKKILLV